MQILNNYQNNHPCFGINIQNLSKVPEEIITALKESGLEDAIDKKYPHAKAEYKKGTSPKQCEKFVIDLGTRLKGQLKRFNKIIFKHYKKSSEINSIKSKIMKFDFNLFEKHKANLNEYVSKIIQIKNAQKIREFLKH